MDADTLITAASDATGLTDFGDDGFRPGLEALIESFEAEAKPNAIGVPTFEAIVTAALSTRLRVTDYWTRHPELADEKVVEPIFIIGVSRSGTTALSHLLSVDPVVRAPRSWETSDPVPPPEAATYETDPRYLAAVAADEESVIHMLNPGFKAMHYDPPDMPTECVTVMSQHMVSLLFSAMFHMPGYNDFVLGVDHVPTYEYHKRVYQLLQSRHPGRWVLKTPHHPLAVDAIAEVYPDARFVWTHRDPATCIASTASISCGLASTFSDADHRLGAGELWARMLTEMLERADDARTRHGDRFVDVDYRELVADPLATTAKLYDDLGIELSAEAARRMTAHVSEHRQHRFGKHEYDFADFGLERDALNDRLATYRATYALD
ncbi:MAG: sulfotransferase [Acidimicrobiales bacterium]